MIPAWPDRAAWPCAVVALTVALAGVTLGATVVRAASETFHLSCAAGDDSADGRTPDTAWRTVGRTTRLELVPGDSLLLERGCRWNGPLRIPWSGTAEAPVTIGAYGEGARPIVENGVSGLAISGSHILVEGLHTRTDPPGRDPVCDDQPAGRSVGFLVLPGASFVTIRLSMASELFAGIRISRGADHVRVLGNELVDNNMKSDQADSDAGAIGVDVQGDDNEIAGNTISGSDACSHFFSGRDGSAVSVFGGRRNVIHHNVSRQNHNFIELGDSRTADTLIAYNSDASSLDRSTFLVAHGVHRYGPTTRTVAVNNTSFLAGSRSIGIQCVGECDAETLSLRDNIVWAEDRIGFSDVQFDHGGNRYWRSDGHPQVFFTLDASSRVEDPGLVDPWTGDLHLAAGSPAVDGGSWSAWTLGFWSDVDGLPVPYAGIPDIGAHERPPGP